MIRNDFVCIVQYWFYAVLSLCFITKINRLKMETERKTI